LPENSIKDSSKNTYEKVYFRAQIHMKKVYVKMRSEGGRRINETTCKQLEKQINALQ
jgi:hypothetical protein